MQAAHCRGEALTRNYTRRISTEDVVNETGALEAYGPLLDIIPHLSYLSLRALWNNSILTYRCAPDIPPQDQYEIWRLLAFQREYYGLNPEIPDPKGADLISLPGKRQHLTYERVDSSTRNSMIGQGEGRAVLAAAAFTYIGLFESTSETMKAQGSVINVLPDLNKV